MIKFISYDGKYPNLCRGVLIVEINGTEYKFGHHYSNCHKNDNTGRWEFIDENPDKPNYPEFWNSGGCVYGNRDGNWNISEGEWEYNENLDDYPEFTEDIKKELLETFNLNVRWGCCGGCI